jgi:hypothetical protein
LREDLDLELVGSISGAGAGLKLKIETTIENANTTYDYPMVETQGWKNYAPVANFWTCQKDDVKGGYGGLRLTTIINLSQKYPFYKFTVESKASNSVLMGSGWYDDDFGTPEDRPKSIKVTNTYYLSTDNGVTYQENTAIKGLGTPIPSIKSPYGTQISSASALGQEICSHPILYRFDTVTSSSLSGDTFKGSGGGGGVGGNTGGTSDNTGFTKSTAEIENYAFKLLNKKSYLTQSSTERSTTPHAVALNIKIQGGILMSDEYIPPVLP